MKNLTQLLRTKIALVLFIFLAGAPVLVSAKNIEPKSEIVKYVGVVEDQVVFQFNYENVTGEIFSVAIKDQNGNVLYSGKFNDKKFSKQFRMDKSELGNAVSLSFILTTQNDKQNQVFNVSSTSRVVEDVVVTKL
jgi:hypothetical protein